LSAQRSIANLPVIGDQGLLSAIALSLHLLQLAVAAALVLFIIYICDRNAVANSAVIRRLDAKATFVTRILEWVGLKTPPDSSNLGPFLLIAVFLFCAGIIAIDAIDPGRVATWFPRGVAVPIIFGAWLPLLSFLSALGRQYKAPFIVALAVAAAGLTFLFGDNHSVRRIDATAQQPERPSKPN